MLNNATNVNAGEITQVNTESYSHHGGSSVTNIARDGSLLSNTIQIRARNAYFHGEQQRPELQATGVLKELLGKVATGAFHNARERGDAPKCHPETRVVVQEEIFSWATDGGGDSEPRRILWLTGPAGAGKTAIAGSVADRCHTEGLLAAGFFFSAVSKAPSVRDKSLFITTLAYQLVQHPSLKHTTGERVLAAVAEDPAIFDKDLMEQLEVLILQPLRDSQRQNDKSRGLPKVLIVDGLDECDVESAHRPSQSKERPKARSKQDDQVDVLQVLHRLVNDPCCPFRIIVASRPERAIQQFFTVTAGNDRTNTVFLDGKYSPDADIRLFLTHKFAQIRRQDLHLSCLPSTWPGEDVIDTLVANASGQFIYAAIVIGFVQTPSGSPEAQLRCVMALRRTGDGNPLRILYDLYTAILTSGSDRTLTLEWLTALVFLQNLDYDVSETYLRSEVERDLKPGFVPEYRSSRSALSAWFFNRFAESSPGEADIAFGHLPSLMRLPDPYSKTSQYSFYHRSFLDFLDAFVLSSPFAINERKWIAARLARTAARGFVPEISLPRGDSEAQHYFQTNLDCLWDGLVKDLASYHLLIRYVEASFHDRIPQLLQMTDLPHHGNQARWTIKHVLVWAHKGCRPYWLCTPACKHWRSALLGYEGPPAAAEGDWNLGDSSVDLRRATWQTDLARGSVSPETMKTLQRKWNGEVEGERLESPQSMRRKDETASFVMDEEGNTSPLQISEWIKWRRRLGLGGRSRR